jgi:CheY-like chemotaxis protein
MSTGKARLLIVDDEKSIRGSLSQIFTQLGYEVRTAEDGFSALAELRDVLPDIILSDLDMPGMSGFELLSVVRRRFPALQVIAMSGAFTGSKIPDGVVADAFYEKGTDFKVLLQKVIAVELWQPTIFRHLCTAAAVWVPSNRDESRAQSYAVLSCPECLRTFPQVLDENPSLIQRAACIFCQSLVLYAILQPSGSVPAGVFPPKSEAVARSSFHPIDLN